jgi:hypothetical protein
MRAPTLGRIGALAIELDTLVRARTKARGARNRLLRAHRESTGEEFNPDAFDEDEADEVATIVAECSTSKSRCRPRAPGCGLHVAPGQGLSAPDFVLFIVFVLAMRDRWS